LRAGIFAAYAIGDWLVKGVACSYADYVQHQAVAHPVRLRLWEEALALIEKGSV
jgi:hypothetical protein